MDYNYHTYFTIYRAFAGRVRVSTVARAKNPATSISESDGERSVAPGIWLVRRAFQDLELLQ